MCKKFFIENNNCLMALENLRPNSIDIVITDPPYFIDGMEKNWDSDRLENRRAKAGVVGSLPVGMKFDRNQGYRNQEFMHEVSDKLFKVLKPGGFYLAFAQARLFHRTAAAIEDAGFEIRDMMAWKYNGQAKAFSQDHFVRKMQSRGELTSEEANDIIIKLSGRKTPQLRPQLEPIVLAQKPKSGTFIQNWLEYGVGLIDANERWDNFFPGNVIECPKPSKKEKGDENFHPTVKPISLISHLIRVFSKEGDIVLDPFMGSGSHGVAAILCNRKFHGIELNEAYYEIARSRLENVKRN